MEGVHSQNQNENQNSFSQESVTMEICNYDLEHLSLNEHKEAVGLIAYKS